MEKMTENIRDPAGLMANDGALASLDPEKIKMRNLTAWLAEQGATFPSVKIEIGQGWREARASAPIRAGALVMHIPQHLFITTEAARASEIGRVITASGCNISDAGYMAVHLAEMKRQGSFWDAYIDVLPGSFSEHPYFLTESDLEYLKGSYVLRIIRRHRKQLVSEYDQLRSCLPKEKMLTYEEYAWGYCIYHTRTHTVRLSGVRTQTLIPLADMLDHSSSANVLWGSRSSRGFLYTAVNNIEAGEPLTICYWRACSGLTLASFGFCPEDNPDNVAEIQLLPMRSDHPCFEEAKNLGVGRDGMRVFRVPRDHEAIASRELLSYLRLNALSDFSGVSTDKAWTDIRQVDVINDANELAAMTALGVACRSALKKFDTSEAEDEVLLGDDALPFRLRNLVQVRRGEKAILSYFLNLAEAAISSHAAD